MSRRIALLDAPSNLGLRPPLPGTVPGCAKAPGALRDRGLVARLGAHDAGCLTPPRYDPGEWRPGDGVCQAPQIAAYTLRLADRINALLDADRFPVVLGGDCSIVLGAAVAMNRLAESPGGRRGLVFVDGHSDFRHPGNAQYVGAAAGEDLALITGRGQMELAGIEHRRPYLHDSDVVVLGIRGQDEYRMDLQAAGFAVRPVPELRAEGATRTAAWAQEQLAECDGFWLHVDVDVLDPAVMPAVDAPAPGGIANRELELLISGLVSNEQCLGIDITVFDPDYDPDGAHAAELVDTLVAGLAPLIATEPEPPGIPQQIAASLRSPTSDRAADVEPLPESGWFSDVQPFPVSDGSDAGSSPVSDGSGVGGSSPVSGGSGVGGSSLVSGGSGVGGSSPVSGRSDVGFSPVSDQFAGAEPAHGHDSSTEAAPVAEAASVAEADPVAEAASVPETAPAPRRPLDDELDPGELGTHDGAESITETTTHT